MLVGLRDRQGRDVLHCPYFVAPFLRADDGLLAALGARTGSGPHGSWVAVDVTMALVLDDTTRAMDPFTAASEAEVCARVLDVRRHGLTSDVA